jgi:hypothetical protein
VPIRWRFAVSMSFLVGEVPNYEPYPNHKIRFGINVNKTLQLNDTNQYKISRNPLLISKTNLAFGIKN